MKAIERPMIRAVVMLALAAAAATGYALPQPKTENGITYVSGGIGADEAKAMLAEAMRYPLSAVFFANRNNEYLADVEVTITDNAGREVLSAISEGPIMLLEIPAGRYTVEAEVGGKTLRRTVQVWEDSPQQIGFHWPRF
ncbi:MAG: carboxypeptidase regulatory-like domain-containing protein [Betaproteobacteria bacterium]|nr:carboxypeptidase regulatory-like domain-containing protein [Betaproteobacteria bacterium]